jgi:hypothetical protein
MTEWPRYESHKIVQATSITLIDKDAIDGSTVLFVHPDPAQPSVIFQPTEPAMAARASIGDYAVVYSDGYKSVSPKKAFDEGYTRVAGDAL